ncbi:MAG: YIP1 family protein [Deltaproteobacteria bacterium]|nr:YIP1 family protein [Deltaproteobacteria bacterium]
MSTYSPGSSPAGNEESTQNSGTGSAMPKLPGGIDPQAIFLRAKEILLSPQSALEKWQQQSSAPQDLLIKYILPLAIVGSLCSWLGMYAIGLSTFLGGLIYALLRGVALPIAVALVAKAMEQLLPKLDGQATYRDGVNLLAFSLTPALIGMFFSLIPVIAVLGLVLAVYSLYLLYIAMPKFVKVGEDKRLVAYGAILILCLLVGFVINWSVDFLVRSVLGISVYRFNMGPIQLDLDQLEKSMKEFEKMVPQP